jgi:hypothetical protein
MQIVAEDVGATRKNLEGASIRVRFPLADRLGIPVFVLGDESLEIATKILPLGERSVEKLREPGWARLLLGGRDEVRKAEAC